MVMIGHKAVRYHFYIVEGYSLFHSINEIFVIPIVEKNQLFVASAIVDVKIIIFSISHNLSFCSTIRKDFIRCEGLQIKNLANGCRRHPSQWFDSFSTQPLRRLKRNRSQGFGIIIFFHCIRITF